MIGLAWKYSNLDLHSIREFIVQQCQLVNCFTQEEDASLPGIRHRQNIPQYFTISNNIHVKAQWWSEVTSLSLYILTLFFCVANKRRQPALIIATCFLILNGSLAVFYAYADLGDKEKHKWLRDHKPINTFLFMMCNIGYGFGMYILVIRQWITAY